MEKSDEGAALLTDAALEEMAGKVDRLATLPLFQQPAAALDLLRDLIRAVRALAVAVEQKGAGDGA